MKREITREEVRTFFEGFVHTRLLKEEIAEMFSEVYEREIHFSDTTDTDNRDLDYRLTANVEETGSGWIDVDIYYLPMRNGRMYITEVCVTEY